jgi:hypothetical protein
MKQILWGIFIIILGCKVEYEDIERWKTTIKGTAKITSVLAGERYPIDLKVRAAIALIEIDAFKEFEAGLKQNPPKFRDPLIKKITVELERMILRGSKPGNPPTKEEVKAKDSLFLMLKLANKQTRKKIEDILIKWTTADFNYRYLTGKVNTEIIMKKIGPRACDSLIKLLEPQSPVLLYVIRLINTICKESYINKARKKLVHIAKLTEPRIPELVLEGLGTIKGKIPAEYLVNYITTPNISKKQQIFALRALRLTREASVVEEVFAIAQNAEIDESVRDEAFDFILESKNPKVLELIWPLLKDKNEKVRWRGVDIILTIGRSKFIKRLLSSLPTHFTYAEEDVRDFLVVPIAQIARLQGKEGLDKIRTLLNSNSWLARLVGIQVLGFIGTKQDIQLLERFSKDRYKPKKWKLSMANVAQQAIERIKKKQR